MAWWYYNKYIIGKHVVFGKVTKGIELLDKIEAIETGE